MGINAVCALPGAGQAVVIAGVLVVAEMGRVDVAFGVAVVATRGVAPGVCEPVPVEPGCGALQATETSIRQRQSNESLRCL